MSKIAEFVASLKGMELPKGAESLLSSIEREASALETDRDDLRGKVQDRQKENDKLKTRAQDAEAKALEFEGKLPKDGTVSVPKADADALESYKAIGTPDELKTAKSEASTLKRVSRVTDAAGKIYNSKAILAHMSDSEDVEPKKTTDKDGKETTVYEVIEGDKRTGLEDWVKSKEAELDYVQFRVAEPGKPPVYTGRGNPGGSVADPTKQTRDNLFKV
jgi:hypothetical protein